MHAPFDQLGKKIVRRALGAHGLLRVEHEIPAADAQSGDVYFVPAPGDDAARAALGWLDRLTHEPCLLELFQRTPGPLQCRACVRKQLALDHAVAREAREQGRRRPPLPKLWLFSTGRPREVIDGYGLTAAEGWSAGVWQGPPLDAMGVVVLRELPRQRDTLLLRLLGRGKVLRDAIEDLKALPAGAKERKVAYEPIVALRLEVQHDPNPDEETRAYVMATQDLYEEWKTRVEHRAEKKGEKKGLEKALVTLYETRFGPLPSSLRASLTQAVDESVFARWLTFMSTAPAESVDAALRSGALP